MSAQVHLPLALLLLRARQRGPAQLRALLQAQLRRGARARRAADGAAGAWH